MSIQRLSGVLLAGLTACALGSMPVAAQSIFVANGAGDSVVQYNLATDVLSAFTSAGSGGLDDPAGLTFGPDGNIYVTGERNVAGVRTDHVYRYNGTTGAFIDVFANAPVEPLATLFGIKFGPDGNLYVANIRGNSVLRFNGTTGALIDNFVAAPGGGLNRPRDLVFGPDGHLYVSSPGDGTASPTRQVLRFNGTTGASMGVFASGVDARGLAFGPGGDLYVANFNGNNVLRFDGVTGTLKATFASGGGLSGPVGVLFGNDGYLYVSSINSDQIFRYDGSTGALIDKITPGSGLDNPRLMMNDTAPPLPAQSLFVANGGGDSVVQYNLATGIKSDFTSAGSGGLDDPAGLTFGPGKNLYVTGERLVNGVRTGSVFRYSGTTGAFIDLFVANTDTPGTFGIKFGPDGNLYVALSGLNSVSRFNGTTGAFIDSFVASTAGGLNRPRDLVFGPDGHLYVSSPGDRTIPPTSQVLRFNGTTGVPMGVFASGVDARGLAFGPGGDLYVANFNGNNVLRFDGVTGTLKATFASGGGLSGPVGVLFGNDGHLYVGSFNSDQIFRYDGSTGAFIDVIASGSGLDAPRLMVKLNDTSPPVLNLPANFAVPATSPAGAAVNYTVTATDNGDPTPKVSCSPLSGANFPIGATTVNCTAKDASGNSSTPGRFTITIDGASAQLLNLISSVGVYSNPFQGITNSLTTKLQNAIDALNAMNKGSELRACNSLSAFINEAEAQSGKMLMPDGAQLIASAIQIRAVLGCP